MIKNLVEYHLLIEGFLIDVIFNLSYMVEVLQSMNSTLLYYTNKFGVIINMTLDGTSKTGIGTKQHDFRKKLDRFIFSPSNRRDRWFLLGIAALAYEDGRE